MAILAISRGTYNDAETLARRVAVLLGYPYANREHIVSAAAERYRIPVEELTAAMERRPSFWDRTLGGAHVAFLPAMRATLVAHTQQDTLVYAGYAGHLLLPGISHVVAIRAVADLDARVQAAVERDRVERGEAPASVEREDRTRREWARFLFGVDWTDPALYHLIVNLSRLSEDTVCDMLIRLAHRPEFQPTRASHGALQELALQNRVLATLAMDFRTRDARLKVTTREGVVTVAGTTRWSEVAKAIPIVVRQVEGVKEVKSEITGGEAPPGLTWY
jgi:cytidylate kinase